MMKKILSITLCCLLSACQTSPNTASQTEKKIAAAKINDRLGIAYLERQDIHRAKQKFLLALEQAPDIPETWYSMAYFLETTGNKEQARNYYKKAIAISPGKGEALNNYGTFLCRTGEYRDAVAHFVRATQDAHYLEQAAAFENAGVCSLKIPDSKNAMAYFQRSLEEDPGRPKAMIELAELNFKQGDYTKAKQQLTEYLKVASPSVETFILEKKLDTKLSA